MRIYSRVNALQITKADGDIDILLTVLYANVNEGVLDVCFRRGMDYVHMVYEAGTWTAIEEV